jgi:hypothetical protein
MKNAYAVGVGTGGIDIGKSTSVAEIMRLVQRPITVVGFTDQ